MLNELKKPYEVPVFNEENQLTNSLVDAWETTLTLNGAKAPTPADKSFAYQTFEMWSRPQILERPVIVAAPPGFGKSTMLSNYLRQMVRSNPLFGAIVVKERIDDMERLSDYVNRDAVNSAVDLLRRNNYAYVIRGFDETAMTREHYNEQFTTQANYNVVIMTTKQFELQVLKNKLNTFASFKDSDGKVRPRRLLIIDEKPSLTVPYTLTSRELNGLVDDIRAASYRTSSKIKRYYTKALFLINEIRKQIESVDIVDKTRVTPVDRDYALPTELLGHFAGTHDISKLTRLRAFEYVVQRGGLVSLQGGIVHIQATRKMHYEWGLFNSFVLDGTGRVDPEYAGEEFYLLEPTVKPDYSNVTFHVCSDFNLSKASIESDLEALDSIAGECKKIAGKHSGKILVITYMQYKAELEKRLADEIIDGKIKLKHFDGGRGSNEYTSFDTAIYIGNLHKGSLYYPATAQATIGDHLGIELLSEFTVNRNGLIYKDPIVENYKKLDMAVNFIQETNRLRANQKDSEVNFYVFNKDNEMINHITSSYEGCNVVKYKTANKLTGKETVEDAVINYFKDMVSGQQVKQSAIYKTLDIHRNTFNIVIQKERVQAILKENYITKRKTFFVKR